VEEKVPVKKAWLVAPLSLALLSLSMLLPVPQAHADVHLDPAHNVPIPCELVSTPGMAPRSAKNIMHVANVCGFVGTDIEFQSRRDATGAIHDYAFVGTMGAGMRIFDITDPADPTLVGAYLDPGWEDDVQVRGDLAVVAFDPLLVGVNVSSCIRARQPTGARQGGVDFIRLGFDPTLAASKLPGTFHTSLLGCYVVLEPSKGAHNATIHPSGEWIAIDNTRTGIEVVDLRNNAFTFVRKIGPDVVAAAHDVFFSRDGNTLYSAGVSATNIADVRDIFNRAPTLIATIPNSPTPDGHTIEISHQSETTADGSIFLITDERGGGLTNTDCNVNGDPAGIIGGAHFWALRPIAGVPASAGATVAGPRKLGTWIYPNPGLALDPLDPILKTLPRGERACTIHMFRMGGNGSNVPGALAPGFDGMSRLPARELVTAHYGAGVWHIDFSRPPSSADGVAEDSRTTWGNTLGWNVMPGADTWSAKEYKGFVYTGDMGRGFDVYRFTRCDDLGCLMPLTSSPGSSSGRGTTADSLAELAIIQGTSAGGRASFRFDARYAAGQVAPSGSLSFVDHGLGKTVRTTSMEFFRVTANTAEFGGTATVNGTTAVRFSVVAQDNGAAGDSFRIVLSDGYLAGGTLTKGKVTVSSP
jgi:hypothetical protein